VPEDRGGERKKLRGGRATGIECFCVKMLAFAGIRERISEKGVAMSYGPEGGIQEEGSERGIVELVKGLP